MLTLSTIFAPGDWFIIIFVLLFMALFPVIIIAIIFFALRRNRKNRLVWDGFARNLGLTMVDSNALEMRGRYNGCEVKLAVGARRSGGEDSHTEYFTYGVSEFPYSLRLLLNISAPKGMLSKIFGGTQMTLGQPAFDRSFNVKCYDRNVLQRFLLSDFPSPQTQNLFGDLMLARQSVGIINITDDKVYIEKSGRIGDEVQLRQMLDTATTLAGRFQTAREKFPLAEWERNLLQNWRRIAADNGLSFDENHFQMQGRYKELPVLVDLRTSAEKWQTQIKMKFPNSLMTGLRIMPENSVHKALSWFGVQDIEVGLKEFDDAFIVKAKNIQMAKHKLRPEVCQKLVALSRQCSTFLIDDETISFTFDTVLGDEKHLKSYLEAIRAISASLAS